MGSPGRPIRIAILGGGLAGAAVFRGLTKHPGLRVDIFESAPAFREQGQAIGFNHNAIWALELLGLKECLANAGAVELNSMRCMIGEGPDMGTRSFDADMREKGTWIVHRSPFLAELLEGIDASRMHVGKKLRTLEQGDEIKLCFEDSSTFLCDILLGADGIHSTIRKYVIGHDSIAAMPTFSGWWTVWTLVPFTKAQQSLGPKLMNPDDPRQYCWCGDNVWIMHDQLSNNTLAQCVICWRVPEDSVIDPSDWMRTTSKEELQQKLKAWDQDFAKGMVDLVSESGEAIPIYSLWHHKPMASCYVKDGIAIVGDAADATTPWQGSGGGCSMEDAYILSELFNAIQTVSDAKTALRAYEKVRQPRRQNLVQSSYETGLTFSGCVPDVGLQSDKMREKLEHKWDWIVDFDLLQHRDEALTAMRKLKNEIR